MPESAENFPMTQNEQAVSPEITPRQVPSMSGTQRVLTPVLMSQKIKEQTQ